MKIGGGKFECVHGGSVCSNKQRKWRISLGKLMILEAISEEVAFRIKGLFEGNEL